MTFLNSILLYGLAAATIPILIHLFTRQKLKKIKFSSLEFLKEMKHEKIRRVKLRQILLIILRTLIILFLVLTFARPAIKGTLTPSMSSSAKTSVAIILDNTLSMAREVDGRQLFDIAKEKAEKIIEFIKPGDEVYFFLPHYPGGVIQIGPKYNLESVKQIIQVTDISYKSTDFMDAILMAQEVLTHSKNINREIYFLTDLQKIGFRQLPEAISPVLKADIKFYLLPLTSDVENNLGIQKVEFGNQIFEKDKSTEINATIKNYGQSVERNKLVQLFLGGRRSAQATINLKPGESQKISFHIIPEDVGFQSGSVLLEDDNLSRDNRRFFTFYVPLEIKVLLVGKSETDLHHLKLALQPSHETSSTITIQTCLSDQLITQRLSQFDAVIFSNAPTIDGIVLQNLSDFVSSGGGIMLFLGSDVDLRNYNDHFIKQFELPKFTESVGMFGNKNSFISFGKIDFSHPIFSNVFESNKKHVESPQFYFSFKIDEKTDIDPIINYNNDYPCFFEVKREKGRILVFTTALDFNWSDLAIKGIFVPILNRSVSYLAGSTDMTRAELLIGDEIIHSSSEIKSEWELEMKLPNESRIRIRPKIQKEKFLIHFTETELPGSYELYNRNNKIGQWAVNVASEESDVQPISIDLLKEKLGSENVFPIDTTDNLVKIVDELRYGQELWKIFILAVLVLLVLEMLLYREKEKAEEIPIKGTKEKEVTV